MGELFVNMFGTSSAERGHGFLFGGVLNEAERSEDFVERVVTEFVLFNKIAGGGGLAVDVLGAHVVSIH